MPCHVPLLRRSGVDSMDYITCHHTRLLYIFMQAASEPTVRPGQPVMMVLLSSSLDNTIKFNLFHNILYVKQTQYI